MSFSPRAKTLSPSFLAREARHRLNVVAEDPIVEELRAERPRTRGDCAGGERPCPFAGCKYHLYLDVTEETGAIKLNFPNKELWELEETCALDVADRGTSFLKDGGEIFRDGVILERVGDLMNITRERIRQIEVRALLQAQAEAPPDEIEDRVRCRPDVDDDEAPPDEEGVVARSRVERGHLPPPRSTDLYRCSVCSVRVVDDSRRSHGCRGAKWELDNSVLDLEAWRLSRIAAIRRARLAHARAVKEERRRGEPTE